LSGTVVIVLVLSGAVVIVLTLSGMVVIVLGIDQPFASRGAELSRSCG